MEKKILAVPSGSLREGVIMLLGKIGLVFQISGRETSIPVIGLGIFDEILFVRPEIIPDLVFSGQVLAGITGFDQVVERGLQFELAKLAEFNFGRSSQRAVRIAIVGRKGEKLVDSPEKIVYAEYRNLASGFFSQAQVRSSSGGTEALIGKGFGDYGVLVVDSGKSLADNGLEIFKVLLESPVVLVVKEETEDLRIFGRMLEGAFRARDFQLLKANVSSADLQAVLKDLKAMESPTINQLANGSFQIETVLSKKQVASVLLAITRAGAKDILIQDINVVL